MNFHIPPYVKGHCDFCDYRLALPSWEQAHTAGSPPAGRPAAEVGEPPEPCVHQGADLSGARVDQIGLDARKKWNVCKIGLGFPVGVVCSCHCGRNCKSYCAIGENESGK